MVPLARIACYPGAIQTGIGTQWCTMHYVFLYSRLTELLKPADSAFASPAAELTIMMPPGTVMKSKTE